MNFSDAAVSENVRCTEHRARMAISVTANTARQAAGAHDARCVGARARGRTAAGKKRTVGRIGIFVISGL